MFRKQIKIEKDQMEEMVAIVDSSALAASAATTGLSSNSRGLKASVSGGTTITFTFEDLIGNTRNFTEAPIVMIERVGAAGTVSLTSSSTSSVVVEVSAGTVDFHIRILGTHKPSL